MNARYYNPNTGRFISQDSYKGSAYEPWTQNLYTYCGNNPTNFIDPTGHMPEGFSGSATCQEDWDNWYENNSTDDEGNDSDGTYLSEQEAYEKYGSAWDSQPADPEYDFVSTAINEFIWAQGRSEGLLIDRYGNNPWCARFVRYCAYQAGLCNIDGESLYGTPFYGESACDYKDAWNGNDAQIKMGQKYTPQTGDIFFYLNRFFIEDYKKKDWKGHVGIVMGIENVDNIEYLILIEGNSNDSVNLVARNLSDLDSCYYINMGAGMGNTVPSCLNDYDRYYE